MRFPHVYIHAFSVSNVNSPNLLDLRSLLGFVHWQCINNVHPLGSVKYHLGSIGGIDATGMEVKLDGITRSSSVATYWSSPAIHVWFEVTHPSYREAECHAEEISEPAAALWRDDALVVNVLLPEHMQ